MISLPKGEIRIGLPEKTRRAKRKAEKAQAASPGSAWRNHISISQGCHPTQVARYRQFVKDFGLTNVEVHDSGDIAFTSRRGMKEFAKATGQCNVDET